MRVQAEESEVHRDTKRPRDGSISDEDLCTPQSSEANVRAMNMAIVIAPTNDAVSAINESTPDSLDEPPYVPTNPL